MSTMRQMCFAAFVVLAAIAGTYARESISITPTFLNGPRVRADVTWKNISNPTKEDFVGVYSPPNTADDAPRIKLFNKDAEMGGSRRFSVLNWRMNYELRYVRSNGVVAARSNIMQVNELYPTQVHLASAGPSAMRVMWVSGSEAETPMVIYGFQSGSYILNATGTSDTYHKNQLCGGNSDKNWMTVGQIHNVVLSSLQPSRVYYYRVGNAEEGWSEEFSFLSAPTVGPNSGVNIFAFGDSGTARCQEMEPWCQPNADATYKDINWDKRTDPSYSMVLHIGDISYAIGYSWRWEQFFSDIEPIASTMPYMVAIGNHEYDWPGQPFKPNWSNYGYDSGGECGMPYFKRFKMPGATTNLWYSYDHGNIHFTVMSTEHDFLPGSEQYQFLVNDMASVDRSKTPWLVFVGHRPMYTTGYWVNNSTFPVHMAEAFEDVLVKFDVDIALWGHVHAYERSKCGIYRGKCSPTKAPYHATIGMAGMNLDDKWLETNPEWLAVRFVEYGYTRIHTTATEFKLQFVAQAGPKTVKDEFTLARPATTRRL